MDSGLVRRVAAPALIALAVIIRIVAFVLRLPMTNSDEATIGLMGLHIARGTDFPAFFYGQHYMGALEAYLAVPLFRLFGPSLPAQRVQTLLWLVVFLACVYKLTRILYGRGLALTTLALLALASHRVFMDELLAIGGYPEIKAFAAALMLLSVRLATAPRPAAFAAWGLVAGLAVWTHWLVLPYVAAAGLLLVAFRWREWRGWLLLAAGFLVGALPLLAYNVTAAPGQDSVSVFLALRGSGSAGSLAAQLHDGLLVGVPLATGLCRPATCGPQLWWGAAYVLLLVAAAALAIRGLRSTAPAEPAEPAEPAKPAEPAEPAVPGGSEASAQVIQAGRVVQAGRLALVAAGLVTIASYVSSPAATLAPMENGRYLTCLLVSTPALLWPLWSSASRLVRALRWGVLAFLVVSALVATAAGFAVTGAATARVRQQDALITTLRRLEVTAIYSEYWTCNRVAFATAEQIPCAVLTDDLNPGHDRWEPYRDEVSKAKRPAFVFLAGTAMEAAFLSRGLPAYSVVDVDGYRVYVV